MLTRKKKKKGFDHFPIIFSSLKQRKKEKRCVYASQRNNYM